MRRQEAGTSSLATRVGPEVLTTAAVASVTGCDDPLAAVLLGRVTGLPLPAVLVPPMALSRLVLGVHYPSDVMTGVAVGAVVAEVSARVAERTGARG